jgi:hypothetical protein
MRQSQSGEHATLSFRDDHGRDHEFRANPGSVLAGLWVWAEHLAISYNWPRSQAAWFLLTGEAPVVPPVSVLIESGVSGPLTGIINVSALAFAREKSVVTAFTMAKRRLFRRRRGPAAAERFAMAAFVDAELANPQRPTWPQIWARWNEFAPRQWRLRGRRLRYENWERMLDAYRREKAVLRAIERRENAASE